MASLTEVVAGQATLGDWMLNVLKIGSIVRRWWKGLLVIAILGAAAGLLYGLANPRKYQAEMIIAVEDDDSAVEYTHRALYLCGEVDVSWSIDDIETDFL
jgi:LPS O-antigen subunit length determinant protein (WzzB/FepE family)